MTISMITIASPIGPLCLHGRGEDLVGLYLPNRPAPVAPVKETAVLARAAKQLDEYFAGKRRVFDLPLAPDGTPFQQMVWRALLAVPFGATASYGDIARKIRRPAASRAVGAANGKNPIAIIVPCHRIIGTSGALTGYGGGMAMKEWLLGHEGALPGRQAAPQLSLLSAP